MSGFTKLAILKTFENMLDETSFDKITVSSLVKRCGISSNTFYYHYHDINDLLQEWITEELKNTYVNDGNKDWKSELKDILYNCRKNKKIIQHIFDSLSRDYLERFFFVYSDDIVTKHINQRLTDSGVPSNQIKSATDICKYTLTGFILKYIWSGMKDDIETSVDELGVVLDRFFNSYKNEV